MKAKDLLYPLHIIKQIIYLPKSTYRQNLLATKVDKINSDLLSLLKEHDDKINNIDGFIHSLDEKIANIKHAMLVDSGYGKKINANVSINNTVSDNHNLDNFYKLFEDKFRGNEEDIKLRISEYQPIFKSLPTKINKMPIIDLGCGRGEFLSFAKDNGLNAIGIDMNHDMISRAKKLGFIAYETDAMSYISSQKTNSLAAITGFHIVEHIPFELLIELFEECYRTLSSGGFALFETPNPNNLIVGSSKFYIDPSHTKPIPPELLSFALERMGFKTEIILNHPIKENIKNDDKDLVEMMHMLYGPQDYAVLAKKI